MDNSIVVQGIPALYDMEINNYIMEQSIHKLNKEISKLGHNKKIFIPKKQESDAGNRGISFTSCTISAVALGIIMAIYGLFTEHGFFNKVLNGIVAKGFLGLIIGGVIGLVIGAIITSIIKSSEDEKLTEKYNNEYRQYQNNLAQDKKRVQAELKQKNILIAERNQLLDRKTAALNNLTQLYNAIGIDNAYRNIVPIGYMNEFIKLNISNHLEGTNGLYYLVRLELRADSFQYSLNEISQKLDQIIDRQHAIYNELCTANNQIDIMVAATVRSAKISAKNNKLLNEAVQNTSIAAYNSERISQELRYQNLLLMYN